ncbi:MAG: RNase adapter RapZ [Dongiaceae bacterium]
MTTQTTAGWDRASANSAPAAQDRRRVLLISGLAGAGRTTALRALEDLGYEAVDNLPLELLPHLVSGIASAGSEGPIAIGIDSRSRGFSSSEFLSRIESLRADPRFELVLVFLDCADDVLIRRFTETRRRHPLAPDRNVADGIARERTLMFPISAVADLMVDTSNRSMAELKRLMTERFALDRQPGLAITVISFSYRIGVPREADLVFDVRFLSNPHYVEALQPLDGETPEVARFIERDPALAGFMTSLDALIEPLLPSYEREGKSYLTIAVGCTGGKHRSVYVARKLADALGASGRPVALIHRDLTRDISGRSEKA